MQLGPTTRTVPLTKTGFYGLLLKASGWQEWRRFSYFRNEACLSALEETKSLNMNYVLLLVILGMAGGAYYEYSEVQKNRALVQEQAVELGGKIDKLQADNKKLEDDKANLAKSQETAQAQIADLSGQVQTAQKALEDANKKAEQAELAVHPPAPAAAPPPSINLGAIQTLDGKTFQNCKLLKIEADGI